jgi:hypothetical protein
MATTRRSFLRQAAAGSAVLGLGDLSFLSGLAPVSAADAALDTKVVRFGDDIEPLVRLLEETPREKLMETVAGRVRQGLSYREVLAALLLAGVRNVQPRPSVGFKFHAVLVVNSAHLASLASPDEDRWLPIFWALDYFKDSQARDVREGDWTMAPVNEAAVPSAEKAQEAFVQAMDSWDEPAADAAVAGLARTAGANQLFELFARYGARDFRSIGHKAIYVANSWRTLQCIGWQYAEPVLRSLAYALLNREGEENPATSDLDADRPWRRNLPLAQSFRTGWQRGRVDAGATTELLATLRTASGEDVCQQVVQLVNDQVAPQSIFDALFLGAGEMLMRQPGIVALHAVTSTNALHYAFQAAANDETRRMLLLQNAAFLPLFRQAMRGRGSVGDARIDQLDPADGQANPIERIFHDESHDRPAAARHMLGYLEGGGSPEELMSAARRLIFLKGNDSHDYKFSSAVLEDFHHVSPPWRNRFLASSVFNLSGSDDQDNQLVQRIRNAFQV